MHSTLAMTAAVWRAQCPALEQSIQLEGIRQKGEAMREVSAWLMRSRSARHDDEASFLMSSMSTLAIVEVCYSTPETPADRSLFTDLQVHDGDFEAAEVHLRAVHNLFSSRGGKESAQNDFILCKSINLQVKS